MIHIRNIPNESSEAEVIQLGVPFGRVTNVLVLKGKNQAFLEMADEVSAAAMVACFNNNPPQVRGRTVYVQFSNHRELKTDQSHSVAVSVAFRKKTSCSSYLFLFIGSLDLVIYTFLLFIFLFFIWNGFIFINIITNLQSDFCLFILKTVFHALNKCIANNAVLFAGSHT